MVLSPISTPVPKSAPTLSAATSGLTQVVAIATSKDLIMAARSEQASHQDRSHVVDLSPSNIWYLSSMHDYNINTYIVMTKGFPLARLLLKVILGLVCMMPKIVIYPQSFRCFDISALFHGTECPTDQDRGEPPLPFWVNTSSFAKSSRMSSE